MRITRSEVFAGPNAYAPLPVIRLELDLQHLSGRSPASCGERFGRELRELLPRLDVASVHAQAHADTAGFALLVAELALDLQRSLGAEVEYRALEPSAAPGRCCVVYELWDEGVALPAAQLALDALLRLIERSQLPLGQSALAWNAAEQREQMLKRLRPASLDLITMAIVREAVERGIPWYRLVPRKPFVQLGQGHRQKHIRESATSHTSSTGRYLSKDKNATSALLARVGIPVPAQRLVTTIEDAIAAANELGFPVVTKPLDRGNGKGVSVGLQHADAVRWGFGEALKYGEQVIVERFVAGEDHRILVIDGRMIAAAKRIPGHVVGDGERTIAQLVDLANEDPRRGREYDKLMVRLEFDAQAEQVLAEAGLARDSVPNRGQVVPLRRTANVSTGGTCVDVTEIVHPDNREAAIRASRILGLNIAGVDFLSTDITRSHREIGGGICEVNFSPGLRPHWNANPGRDVVGPIVDTMFAPQAPCRIPIAAVVGASGATAACRLAAHLLASSGRCVGSATSTGAEIGGRLVAAGDMTGADGARTLIFDPLVEAAVVECAPQGVLERGLALGDYDVAVVLDGCGSARLGQTLPPGAVPDPIRVVIQAATAGVVLNADEPRCLEHTRGSEPRRVCLFSTRSKNDAVSEHVASGGLAVRLRGDGQDAELSVEHAGQRLLAAHISSIPLIKNEKDGIGGQVLCAAVALAWLLGVRAEHIRRGLASIPAPSALLPLATGNEAGPQCGTTHSERAS